jgi:hypothetical protein
MSDSVYNRFNEVAATAFVQVKLDVLKAAVTAPNAKAFAKQRVTRQGMWREMAEVCLTQANALDEVPAPRKRAPKVVPTTPTVVAT